MEKMPILALMYDFDHTLSPRDMQEYAFIPELNMESDDFWALCRSAGNRYRMDPILAYMYVMLQEAKKRGMTLTAWIPGSSASTITARRWALRWSTRCAPPVRRKSSRARPSPISLR